MGVPGSSDLRGVYERQYSAAGADAARYGAWRALSAKGKADHVLALTRGLDARPRSLVEVGCGDGGLLEALAARGLADSLHGFEISERAVRYASAGAAIERVERFDGSSLPAADGAYDLGVLSHVLEHVGDPLALLAETARVSRAVVVEVPLEDNRSASRTAARRGREAIGHLHRFSRVDVRALMSDAGLRVAAEVADPLPYEVHAFWARSAAQRARAGVKWAVRRALFGAAPALAERTFTVHYACLGVR